MKLGTDSVVVYIILPSAVNNLSLNHSNKYVNRRIKYMSQYDEDRANSQVNTNILEQEFDIDTTEENEQQIQEIRDMRNQLAEVIRGQKDQDPDIILLTNIERANTLLDTAQNAILNGGETNARMYEVCGQLINSITSAATSVQNSSFGLWKHEYNMKMVEVKEKEVAVKAALAAEKAGSRVSGTGTDTNNTVMVMTREDLLDMIHADEIQREVCVETIDDPIDDSTETSE